jgi:hypothetical protein
VISLFPFWKQRRDQIRDRVIKEDLATWWAILKLLQSGSHRGADGLARDAALFEPRVPRDAHRGQGGELLPTEPVHPPPDRTQAEVAAHHLPPPDLEEVAQLPTFCRSCGTRASG